MLCENPNDEANGAQHQEEAEAQQHPLSLDNLVGLHRYAQKVGFQCWLEGYLVDTDRF